MSDDNDKSIGQSDEFLLDHKVEVVSADMVNFKKDPDRVVVSCPYGVLIGFAFGLPQQLTTSPSDAPTNHVLVAKNVRLTDVQNVFDEEVRLAATRVVNRMGLVAIAWARTTGPIRAGTVAGTMVWPPQNGGKDICAHFEQDVLKGSRGRPGPNLGQYL